MTRFFVLWVLLLVAWGSSNFMKAQSDKIHFQLRLTEDAHPNLNRTQRDPNFALGISAFNTAIPVLAGGYLLRHKEGFEKGRLWLLAYGILLGPSTGYIYGRNYGRALGGFAVRSLGSAVSILGLGIAIGDAIFYEDRDRSQILPMALYFGGILLVSYSIVRDFIKVRGATLEANEKISRRAKIRLLPCVLGKKYGYGITLIWRP